MEIYETPGREELLECMRIGCCPWCGKSGFQVLSGHTSRIHGITADELRDMAGLFKHNATCTPRLSAACRVRNMNMPSNGIRKGMGSSPGRKKQFSRAGRVHQDTVKTPLIRSMAPIAHATLAKLRQKGRHFGRPFKPHNCPACGVLVSTAYPITCSPECRKIVRQRTAQASAQKRRENRGLSGANG